MNFNDDDIRLTLTEIGVNLNEENFNLNDVKKGIDVEMEHGLINPKMNITDDQLTPTVKIALAHLYERGDYYDMLEYVEDHESVFGINPWILMVVIAILIIIILFIYFNCKIECLTSLRSVECLTSLRSAECLTAKSNMLNYPTVDTKAPYGYGDYPLAPTTPFKVDHNYSGIYGNFFNF
ncbi:MAG: hypothetical protein KAS12_01875 [Candidatus Aenigmarchaeota archaeon]|nr:hypothetical protein [Candidatus Aenigmarchaeota archaeon]